MQPISRKIATELVVGEAQIIAAIALLDGGATVPFIARYRKEATGGLSDIHLRHLQERLGLLRELEERRLVILKGIRAHEKLVVCHIDLTGLAGNKTHSSVDQTCLVSPADMAGVRACHCPCSFLTRSVRTVQQ